MLGGLTYVSHSLVSGTFRPIIVVEDYNENVSDIYKIPSMGRESTLAILVGMG